MKMGTPSQAWVRTIGTTGTPLTKEVDATPDESVLNVRGTGGDLLEAKLEAFRQVAHGQVRVEVFGSQGPVRGCMMTHTTDQALVATIEQWLKDLPSSPRGQKK